MTPHHTRNRVLAAAAFVVALVACLQHSTTVFYVLLAVTTLILSFLMATDVFRYRSSTRPMYKDSDS